MTKIITLEGISFKLKRDEKLMKNGRKPEKRTAYIYQSKDRMLTIPADNFEDSKIRLYERLCKCNFRIGKPNEFKYAGRI